jgi:hypothetical protein
MKILTKIIMTAAAAMVLTTSVSADDLKLGSVQLGVASSARGSEPSDAGPYMGGDFFMPIVIDGLGIGVGFDVLTIGDAVNAQGSSDSYTMGGQIKLAYSLKSLINWDANIKGEVGYGLTHVDDTSKTGVQYGIGASVQIYKHFGIGYKYKVIDTGFGDIDDVESHIGYVQWAW